MATITKCLAINVRRFRQQRGLTQTQLAEKAGISLIFLQGIEGERKWISPSTVKTIARALRVKEPELFLSREGRFRSDRASKKSSTPPLEEVFETIPKDVVESLAHVCRHPKWKWEAVRWILDGYRQHHP